VLTFTGLAEKSVGDKRRDLDGKRGHENEGVLRKIVKVQARFVSRQNDLEAVGQTSEGGKRILPALWLNYVSIRSALSLAQN
jgi:hypothetical protein